MNKENIVKIIADEFNVSEIEVLNYFDDIFETLIECFRKNKNVNISEFGKFFVRVKLNADGVKEQVVRFSPVKKLADDINYNFNNLTKARLRTLDEKTLEDQVPLQRIDVELPQDLEEFEYMQIEEDEVQEKEEVLKDYIEPLDDKKKESHLEDMEIEKTTVEEESLEESVEPIIKEEVETRTEEKETLTEEEETPTEEEETSKTVIEKGIQELTAEKEDVHEKSEEEKGFDIDTEMKSFLLEHININAKKEETVEIDEQASTTQTDLVEDVSDKTETEEEDISTEGNLKDELDKITEERDKVVDEIKELDLEKTEDEKVEELPVQKDEAVEEIIDKEKLQEEKLEFEKEEEQYEPKELDKDISKSVKDVKEEIEQIFEERNKVLSEMVELNLDKTKTDEELPSEVIEEKDFEEPAELDDSDKQKSIKDISDEDEIVKIIEERKRILEKIQNFETEDFKKPESKDIAYEDLKDVEIDQDEAIDGTMEEEKPETIEEEAFPEEDKVKQEEESYVHTSEFEDIDKQKSIKDISDEDEKVRIMEVRKRILEKIQNFEMEDFKKPGSKDIAYEDLKDVESKQEKAIDENIEEEKEETMEEETFPEEDKVKLEEETFPEEDKVKLEEESYVHTSEFDDSEKESIRSGIFSSNNIEEDIYRILDERKKIIDDIANVELTIFDKLMDESEKEEDDTEIKEDIENLSKMKTSFSETYINPQPENTVISQQPVESDIEPAVEFKMSKEVQDLHEDITKEDSDKKENTIKDEQIKEPKNFDDIFVQDDQKVYTKDDDLKEKKNDEEGSMDSDDNGNKKKELTPP